MKEHSFLYKSASQDGNTTCLLCPHRCRIKEGGLGICRSRTARNGRIIPLRPMPVTAVAMDPIEKKPFFHYHPGSEILSIGFSGCNLQCPFCQNWRIAHTENHDFYSIQPDDLPRLCRQHGSRGTAFTYSEPLIHFEYLMESAEILHKEGYEALLVTNGFINPLPGEILAKQLDAVKVDLKGFTESWYQKELKGQLKPVLDFITLCAEHTHLEVVTLVIPGKNDEEEDIRGSARFLASLNPSIPYHLTAYYPQYHYTIPPTEEATLTRLADIAREYLHHVYTGNLGLSNPTICPECGEILINRNFRTVSIEGIKDNLCTHCDTPIYGHF